MGLKPWRPRSGSVKAAGVDAKMVLQGSGLQAGQGFAFTIG